MRILKLTRKVEKELLAARAMRDRGAERVAARIVEDVRRRGDAGLFAWTKRLDGIDLRGEGTWVEEEEFRAAEKGAKAEFVRAIRQTIRNLRRVAKKQLPREWSVTVERGVKIRQMVRPIESIGCYIPGGRHALVSTLLMTVAPAQVAGVKRITAVCARPTAEVLIAARLVGVGQIARIGGAQAIAALAYGTETIPRVEKIFGPGNRFVTAAKQLVSGDCGIDLPAGPTEAVVLAERGNARWIAADLLAQAEHAEDAGSFLVTSSRWLAERVGREVEEQLKGLPEDNPARASMKRSGAILVSKSVSASCEFVNRFAPEHLSLPANAEALLKRIESAGTIFAGPWGAQPLGDYVSGSNHVLPTGGWARKRGGLSAADFVKCLSVQTISRRGFAGLANAAKTFAEAEGLMCHRNAVRVRQ